MFETVIITITGVVATGFLAVTGWFVKSLVELKSGLAEVTAQHQNNGGKSLRDAVDRIERKVDVAASTLSDHLILAAGESALLNAHLAQPATQVVVHNQAQPQ